MGSTAIEPMHGPVSRSQQVCIGLIVPQEGALLSLERRRAMPTSFQGGVKCPAAGHPRPLRDCSNGLLHQPGLLLYALAERLSATIPVQQSMTAQYAGHAQCACKQALGRVW